MSDALNRRPGFFVRLCHWVYRFVEAAEMTEAQWLEMRVAAVEAELIAIRAELKEGKTI
ncbi:hypothetical protein WSK_3439 [Novosphingobium sp. Rr 2-17]|uniref:DUF5320 domain-containing protein n=1 Tax=Novosphingobium sp. Rr 2-17 TaxID=555793 RepID=UPI0002699BEC|nr:DUF5320 domain-containing protein [Novosphingobium sp. Rr 2-17]EIZ77963.1 hypothetical protein WSK_3439 [Novosphingobium sp. Rr 2-17]